MPHRESLELIERTFNRRFGHWAIRLPPEDVKARRRGKILMAGWAIWYLFGADEKGEYLDYYASHRMTDDSHVRIRPDASCEGLPAIASGMILSGDPKEDARRKAEYFRSNQEVAALLAQKGFGPAGDEPGGVLINRYLHLNSMPKPHSKRKIPRRGPHG